MTPARFVRRVRVFSAAVLLATCVPDSLRAAAAPKQPSQAEVEAVYLFDFGRFVRWPAAADHGRMHLCVAGSGPVGDELEKTIASETLNGRALDVRHVARPEDESGCAVLFVDSSDRIPMNELLDAVDGKPVLTVSDIPGFCSRGGMVEFELIDKRVRFSVNLDAVTRGHLGVSAELLKVAVNVVGHLPNGGAQ